jgi:hypothetical protein
MSQPVKCGGCKGNGNCSRCQGSGVEGQNEKQGFAVVLGPITCKRCGGNGICPGCRGSGWIMFPPAPKKEDSR